MGGVYNDKQGSLALFSLLTFSTHLCWLDIAQNKFEREAVYKLHEALKKNSALTALYAKNCGLSEGIIDNVILANCSL